MRLKVCKWYNNATSPVVFMVDDLCNTWVDINKNGQPSLEKDWGAMGFKEGSVLNYIEQKLLKNHPEVKVTFFVPVGKRTGVIQNSSIPVHSEPMDHCEESRKFFAQLHHHSRYELAYHGTTHGIPGDRVEDFVQEWATYKSKEEALDVIKKGKNIFENAVAQKPQGGKYCGNRGGDMADQSIDESGFDWWCRNSNYQNINLYKFKDVHNPELLIQEYQIRYFGKNDVIDIPSTIPGSYYNSVFAPRGNILRKIVKKLLYKRRMKRKNKVLDVLLANQLVLTVQEHISPSRNDGKIQMPNIVSDYAGLQHMFRYLKDKNVWYCTGSELAEYIRARDAVEIENIEGLQWKFVIKDQRAVGKTVTLETNDQCQGMRAPDGSIYWEQKGIINVPVLKGIYTVIGGTHAV